MLIERIIKFELDGPGTPGRICTSTADYFHNKTKISTVKLEVDHYLQLKYCWRQCFSYLGQINHRSLPQNARF